MKNTSLQHAENKIWFVSVCFKILIFTLLLRLFIIQVLQHEKYASLAREQYWNLSVIPSQRGDILSSDHSVLAGTQNHYLLYIEPKKVINKVETAHLLADVLAEIEFSKRASLLPTISDTQAEVPQKEDKQDYFAKYFEKIKGITDADLYWAIVSREITPVDKQLIESKNIVGIGFEDEPIRFYPENTLASHILGFVAFNGGGEKQGYFGVEGALNGDLKGKPGRILEEQDAVGNPILIGQYKKSAPIKGRDIVLTIDRDVQYTVERLLKEGVEKTDSKSGSVIVMNPHTGEIIAMANYPTYRPDDFSTEEIIKEDTHRKNIEKVNLSISQTYEPGSVIKPFTVASAIDQGLVTKDTTFEDNGPVNYSGYIIDNWNGQHLGTQTITQLLEKSNNIGAAWLGHKVGAESLSAYFKNFGFGKKTEIELEGEDTGLIHAYEDWTDIDLANIAFGQGISATPLQVLSAFCSLANEGILMKPKIISQVIDEDRVIDMPNRELRRVISKQTSDTMTDILISAVDKGESKFFNIKNYNIAGKTGTAQIAVEGKYLPDKTNATFVGYLAGSKKYAMIVKLEQPTTSIYAAETAVPLWMKITDELVKYYGIAPDK